MRSLITLLTVATSLTHAVLGCCAHEVHHGESGLRYSDVESHAHHHGAPTEHGDNPEQQSECCHLKCQWHAPSATGIQMLLAADSYVDAPLATLSDTLCLDLVAVSQVDAQRGNFLSAQPLRLHLSIGVLLI